MAHRSRPLIAALVLGALAAPSQGAAKEGERTSQGQGQGEAQDEDQDESLPAPLTVGSMTIASDPALEIEAMALDVSINRVTYTYKLRNKGATKLALAASVAMPDLEINSDGTTFYTLPADKAENPVDLTVKAGDVTIPTTSSLQAIALEIDRLAELKTNNIPLIPFGDDAIKAIAAAKPDVMTRFQSLGLVTPRDPAQPDAAAMPDWSLHNVIGWTQPIDANATTNLTVSFAPVKAVYLIDAAGLPGFDALKDQACLTPQVTNAAKAMLKAKGSTLDVVDLTLANDGPARWLENPKASVTVTKPKPNSVIAFCGMNAATANQPLVKGTLPDSADASGLRILMFSTH